MQNVPLTVGEPITTDALADAGYLVLSAPAEPHAHLDKALTADRVDNLAGDLTGAIEAWIRFRPTITADDYVERAERALRMGLANGCTSVRTHVDIGDDSGTLAVESLLAVRAAWRDRLDLQIVGLVGLPTSGPVGAANRASLIEALDLGVDIVGGCPHLDPDPLASLDVLLELAADRGLPIDLHTDENLRIDSLDLESLADAVIATGFEHGVVASHCVSLGIQPLDVQRRVAEKVAAAGIAVVALPQTNLFLQARGQRTGPVRGLTAIATLLEAGVTVGAGADNLQDPFCLVGRADPLETAALLIMTAHLTPEQAYDAVSVGARTAMGLGPTDDRLAIRAATLREAIATAPADRIVVRGGVVVRSGDGREGATR
jgi:cytosine deaminase